MVIAAQTRAVCTDQRVPTYLQNFPSIECVTLTVVYDLAAFIYFGVQTQE
jgi:hypothetical protein